MMNALCVQVLCRENCETVPDSGTGYEIVRKALPKVFPETQHRCGRLFPFKPHHLACTVQRRSAQHAFVMFRL